MLLMYRSRNNLAMIVEIVKNQRSDYFSKTEHENKSSMTTVFGWISAKKTHQKPEQNKTPICVLPVRSEFRGNNDLHELLSFSLTPYLFVKQESPRSLAGATNLPSKFL